MKKKLLIVALAFILFKVNGFALTYAGCDYSDVARLRSYIDNINLYYDYRIDGEVAYFNITLTNIPEGVYFLDNATDMTYKYENTNNGEITLRDYIHTKGNFIFYSALSDCYGLRLGTKYYNLPSYNKYYQNTLCNGISDFSLCQKWSQVNYDQEEFETLVNKYREIPETTEPEQKIVYTKGFFDYFIEFYIKYYYIFLGTIIIVLSAIIFFKNRKEKFDL